MRAMPSATAPEETRTTSSPPARRIDHLLHPGHEHLPVQPLAVPGEQGTADLDHPAAGAAEGLAGDHGLGSSTGWRSGTGSIRSERAQSRGCQSPRACSLRRGLAGLGLEGLQAAHQVLHQGRGPGPGQGRDGIDRTLPSPDPPTTRSRRPASSSAASRSVLFSTSQRSLSARSPP